MATIDDIAGKLDDITSRLENIEQMVFTPQAVHTLEGLSDIDENLGLIKSGEFRSGAGDPGKGDGFSGIRMGYPGFTYGGKSYNVVGVDADTLQFGLRSSDGAAIAGGGSVILDADGVSLKEPLDYSDAANLKYYPSSSWNAQGGLSFGQWDSDAGMVFMQLQSGFDNSNFAQYTARTANAAVCLDTAGPGSLFWSETGVWAVPPTTDELPDWMDNHYPSFYVRMGGSGSVKYSIYTDRLGNLGLFGSTAPSDSDFGGADGVIYIKNATTTTASNPIGGGFLCVEAGALVYRGSGGTVTPIASA